MRDLALCLAIVATLATCPALHPPAPEPPTPTTELYRAIDALAAQNPGAALQFARLEVEILKARGGQGVAVARLHYEFAGDASTVRDVAFAARMVAHAGHIGVPDDELAVEIARQIEAVRLFKEGS